MIMIQTKPAIIIGQAQKPETRDTPFIKSHLWKWFARIGYEQDEIMRLFHFDALVDQGTPKGKKGRVPPQPEQMKLYRPKLVQVINAMAPRLIVPIGNLAVRAALNQRHLPLEEAVGQRFVRHPFGTCGDETVLIPLPHPSGVSLWLNSAHNKSLFEQALYLLKEEMDMLAKKRPALMAGFEMRLKDYFFTAIIADPA
ncbi:MAG: Uracil glycosylase superfamily protein [Alphaproteobacteria bacterium]|nr:Uracil glycosylase superfamily protein [Alphaproteobacteria bacterium]